MQMLASNPAEAYRKVDLDARIEASDGGDLTLICLEEAVAYLGQAMLSLDRDANAVPAQPLSRAHGIAVWLARGVAQDNPLREAMVQFYTGLAMAIAENLARPAYAEIERVRGDFADILAVAKAG